MRNSGLGEIINSYALRDGFNAAADRYDDPQAVSALLTAVKEMENLLTYYYPEYPDEWAFNRKVEASVTEKLAEIANKAFAFKAGGIVLPVPAASPLGAVVSRIVYKNEDNFPVKVYLPA